MWYGILIVRALPSKRYMLKMHNVEIMQDQIQRFIQQFNTEYNKIIFRNDKNNTYSLN